MAHLAGATNTPPLPSTASAGPTFADEAVVLPCFASLPSSSSPQNRTRHTVGRATPPPPDNSSHQLKNAVNALKRSQNLQNHIAATDLGALAAPLQLLVTLSDAGGARLR